ncbi:hypothetical protein [Paucibacter soli]|uniref:hypothetical protein n=1 Tax=Paucibacter soli TaxID=3133433 RepID=UPI00309D2BD2
MNKLLSAVAVALSISSMSASAANVSIEVQFNGSELPYFGVTANSIRRAVANQLQAAGHTIVDRESNPNGYVVYAQFSGWSTVMDQGRTTLAKSEGMLQLFESFNVVVNDADTKPEAAADPASAAKADAKGDVKPGGKKKPADIKPAAVKPVQTKIVTAATNSRLCSGLATDDRRSLLSETIERCVANFIKSL